MDISDWRSKIDALDEVLVYLLNRRAQYALEIGRIKREQGGEVYSPEREKEVLGVVQRLNRGPLDNGAIKRVFQKILEESRRLESRDVEG
ncbi:MAG TPA: chorismate mutase [Candidatus Latescibacteria bacterium]|nr:chorismate mutase [Candidatus Latescibacterota bacterium]